MKTTLVEMHNAMGRFAMVLVLMTAAGCATGHDGDDAGSRSGTAASMESGHASGEWIELDPGAPFEERALRGERPVLVQCYSPYCGKCRELAPVLRSLSTDYRDRVDFVRVDTFGADAFVNEYEVIGLPMLLFFREGRVVDRLIGTIEESEIRGVLDGMLGR